MIAPQVSVPDAISDVIILQMVINFSPINAFLPTPDQETKKLYTIAHAKDLYCTCHSFIVYLLLRQYIPLQV